MPSTSKKQHNFMAAVAKNPAFAKKVGIKQSVGEEFMKADKGRKFKEGGAMDLAQDKKMVKKAVGMHDKQLHGGKKTNLTKLAKGGYCGGGKMKAKRYNTGGELPDYEREPDAQDRAQQEGAMAEYTDRKEKEAIYAKPLAKASFKEAFADARADGKKTFEYMGKQYSTDLAKPERSFADKAKKAGFTSAETKGGAALMTRKDRGYKAGGSVRGCGIAQRGKTKGRMV